MSSRRLSLHPSALSDAEYTLFTTSLADLAEVDPSDPTLDWERLSVSVREARAWLCGRYASVGSGRIDEILRLFPAPTLSGEPSLLSYDSSCIRKQGAQSIVASPSFFFYYLRTLFSVLFDSHRYRCPYLLAAVPGPTPNTNTHRLSNPFLPTPAPSPEHSSRFPMNRPTGKPSTWSESSASTSSSSIGNSTYSSGSSSSASGSIRRTHAYSNSLNPPASASVPLISPPTHPLRRASTQTKPPNAASSASALVNAPQQQQPLQRASSNPFRAPPLPPRRASTSTSPFASNAATSPFASNTNHAAPRTAPPTRTTFAPGPPPPPPPRSASMSGSSPVSPSTSSHPSSNPSAYSPFSAQVLPPTPSTEADSSPFDAPMRTYPLSAGPNAAAFAGMSIQDQGRRGPPVHPHRRATSGEASPVSATFNANSSAPPSISNNSNSNSSYGAGRRSGDARRVSSDSAARPVHASSSSPFSAASSPFGNSGSGGGGGGALPLALPKALRRTLAGAGWVGAERGEREGLVRGGGGGADAGSEGYNNNNKGGRGGGYGARNVRRVQNEVGGAEGEEEAWGAL
ncbi:hypothetical protein K438DRAFT_1975204 [Mycena galopus ATCC 62051]|nr:hypothetical protein K438DRAFT_1975204 [Mycena galopus ATCC 62051]